MSSGVKTLNNIKHIPALDGVRGMAILIVMLTHYREILWQTGLEGKIYNVLDLGWSGVDLFFVLSGFLITGILVDSRERPLYFQTFYWRRFLRISPLYYFYLFLLFLVLSHVYRVLFGRDPWAGVNVWWYLTYLCNWKANHTDGDPHLGHMWSLAVEEQFYLIWPLIVYLCLRRRLAWVCVAVAAMALGIRCAMTYEHFSDIPIYRITPTRMDALALGSLVALAWRNEWWRRALSKAAAPLAMVTLAAITAIAWRTGGFNFSDPLVHTIGVTFLEILFACLVFLAADAKQQMAWPNVFGTKFLRVLGKYSYGMYIFHFTPHLVLMKHVARFLAGKPQAVVFAGHALYMPLLMALTFGVASVSWRFLESPFLALKDRMPLPGRLKIQPAI